QVLEKRNDLHTEHDPEKWIPVFGKDHAQTKTELKRINRKDFKCPSYFAWPAPAPRSGRSTTSSRPTRARRATAVSSSGSATSIRCCRRTTRTGSSSTWTR